MVGHKESILSTRLEKQCMVWATQDHTNPMLPIFEHSVEEPWPSMGYARPNGHFHNVGKFQPPPIGQFLDPRENMSLVSLGMIKMEADEVM